MKKVTLLALALPLVLTGCYANFAAPAPQWSVQFDAPTPAREGKAMCTEMIGFVTGDCSVSTAMRNGRITKLHHIDSEAKVIFFGAYAQYTTVVHGE